MYVNPFWLGVGAALFVEMAIAVIATVWSAIRYSEKEGDGDDGNEADA